MGFARRTGAGAVSGPGRSNLRILLAAVLLAAVSGVDLRAQTSVNERVFPQSKESVEKALKNLQANMGGRLPVLDGFAKAGQHALDRYQRGYYQTSVQVNATAAGGSLVRVTVKVTAWYSDPAAGRSGYELLTSNGRLEADLLDQLADQLASGGPAPAGTASSASVPTQPSQQASTVQSSSVQPAHGHPTAATGDTESAISAPAPKFPETGRTFPSSVSQGLAERARSGTETPERPNNAQAAEIESLREAIKNQGHPKNLVAVKKSGTPVVGSPSLTAKPLFLASLHDEFEMLNFNADWVHVRISGLSRGWIWRNSVEMPVGIPDTDAAPAKTLATAADLYHVMSQEVAQFPGDWEPLRGKNVKIVSVQKSDETAKDGGPTERLEYVKFLLDKNYPELSQKPAELAGLVVIFDSIDGGMVAATMPTLQEWRAGKLSDSALWHKCFFDPPETFDPAGAAASQ
jgi:hypothetical protein